MEKEAQKNAKTRSQFPSRINSTKNKDESVLCVVVVNRALHSKVQSSAILCAM